MQRITESWSLVDLQTPDTVYVPLLNDTYIVNPLETISLPANSDSLIVNGENYVNEGLSYTAGYDTLVNKSNVFYGETPIHHGFRINLDNHAIGIDTARSGFQGITSETNPTYTFNVFRPGNVGPDGSYAGVDIPFDYEIEFFDEVVGQSIGDTLYPPTTSNRIPARDVTFKVKNLTTGEYIPFVYFTTGVLSTVHNIYFKENLDGKVWRTWRVNIFYLTPNAPIEESGTLTMRLRKPFRSEDVFSFTARSAAFDDALANNELDLIKVVPNPYVVTHAGEERLLSTQTSGRGEREIRFTHIPPGAKITIYTVRGELIKTLYHDDLFVGDVYWNLRTEENIDTAYGVYIYVVEVPNVGKKIDKFALIK